MSNIARYDEWESAVMVPDQCQRERIRPLHDEPAPYHVSTPGEAALDALLRDAPLPD